MNRYSLLPCFLLFSACGVEEIEAIIANHEMTYVSTTDTADPGTSTTSTSTTADSTGSVESTTDGATSTTTAGAEAGMDASTAASDMSSSSTSDATTGPPAPSCGDGHVDPGETCDDMNDDPDDGCKACARDSVIFLSSAIYQGGALQGLYGADQRCRMLAALAGLPNFGTFRAWLSDSKTSAADRLFHSPGRYVLVNGLVVAADWDGLTSGTLQNPINVTETSQTATGSAVWTGTLPDGKPAFGVSFCDDWTAHNKLQQAGAGIMKNIDAEWTFFEQTYCLSDMALYCIEQPTP